MTYEYLTIRESPNVSDNQSAEWPTPLYGIGRWAAKGWEVVNSKIMKPRAGSHYMCDIVFLLRRQKGIKCFMDGCSQPLHEEGLCRSHFDREDARRASEGKT